MGGDYEVGKGKPPKHTQFGQPNGNRQGGGRPKGYRNMRTLLKEKLDEKVPGSDLTWGDALVQSLLKKSISQKRDDPKIILEVLKYHTPALREEEPETDESQAQEMARDALKTVREMEDSGAPPAPDQGCDDGNDDEEDAPW